METLPAMSTTPRKVLEVLPRLQQRIKDEANSRRVALNLLATVLVAYAVEHMDDAIHDADRLLAEWEGDADPPDWPRTSRR